MLDSFRRYGIDPTSKRTDPRGAWEHAPGDLRYDRVRFDSMRSDKDEVFRFLWDNREKLGVRQGAYTEVLSVLPCTRVGPDGFTLRETVAQYYQVARLTPRELLAKRIGLPRDYVAALQRERREAERRGRKARANGEDHTNDTRDDENDDEVDSLVTPVYGGGVLIFDEYGKLKYHVNNDVFGSRQAQRLQYLWDIGQLHAGKRGAQLTWARLPALHRQRSIDARRFPERGW
jgi:hypothetical protein